MIQIFFFFFLTNVDFIHAWWQLPSQVPQKLLSLVVTFFFHCIITLSHISLLNKKEKFLNFPNVFYSLLTFFFFFFCIQADMNKVRVDEANQRANKLIN